MHTEIAASPRFPAALLKITNVCAGYGGAGVLHDVSLHVERGEFVCVIGANTAGKSTLLRAISGLVPRVSGSILFDGVELTKEKRHAIPALGIAHVPEGLDVFPQMPVEENLGLGAYTRRRDFTQDKLDCIYTLFPRL